MTDTPSTKGAISRVTSQAAAHEAAMADRARRQRLARERRGVEPPPPGRQFSCRVLPLGDGLISTGEHVAGVGEITFERGDVFVAAEDVAQRLEARGFVEIRAEPAANAETPQPQAAPEPAGEAE